MHKRKLPNGLEIVEINAYETDFLYDEIFEQEVYSAHQVEIAAEDVVIDVGANIGLFALYIERKYSPRKIMCFEPAPHCFEVITENAKIVGPKVELYREAVSDKIGATEFTYYPNYTIMSSLFADPERDDRVLRAGAKTKAEKELGEEIDDRMVKMMVGGKLGDPVSFECPTVTISSIIDRSGLSEVGLLKIDVECAENAVLAGIEDRHWPSIRQIVVEVHDQGDREHLRMRDLLTSKGYEVYLSAEPTLANSGIYEIVARR